MELKEYGTSWLLKIFLYSVLREQGNGKVHPLLVGIQIFTAFLGDNLAIEYIEISLKPKCT